MLIGLCSDPWQSADRVPKAVVPGINRVWIEMAQPTRTVSVFVSAISMNETTSPIVNVRVCAANAVWMSFENCTRRSAISVRRTPVVAAISVRRTPVVTARSALVTSSSSGRSNRITVSVWSFSLGERHGDLLVHALGGRVDAECSSELPRVYSAEDFEDLRSPVDSNVCS